MFIRWKRRKNAATNPGRRPRTRTDAGNPFMRSVRERARLRSDREQASRGGSYKEGGLLFR